MLHFVLWKWKQDGFREVYTKDHVNDLAKQIRANMKDSGIDYRVVLVADDWGGVDMSVDVHPLWRDFHTLSNASGKHLPSCYRRLKLFDPETQTAMGIKPGDRIMSVDLDTLITGKLKHLVSRKERFVGWARRGVRHLRVFNGSLFLFSAGDFAEIWHDFEPAASPKQAFAAGYYGSDQGWLSYKLAKRTDCAGWSYPEVVSFPTELTRRPRIPDGCAIVNFHGKKKPWHIETQKEAPWIKALYESHRSEADATL